MWLIGWGNGGLVWFDAAQNRSALLVVAFGVVIRGISVVSCGVQEVHVFQCCTLGFIASHLEYM